MGGAMMPGGQNPGGHFAPFGGMGQPQPGGGMPGGQNAGLMGNNNNNGQQQQPPPGGMSIGGGSGGILGGLIGSGGAVVAPGGAGGPVQQMMMQQQQQQQMQGGKTRIPSRPGSASGDDDELAELAKKQQGWRQCASIPLSIRYSYATLNDVIVLRITITAIRGGVAIRFPCVPMMRRDNGPAMIITVQEFNTFTSSFQCSSRERETKKSFLFCFDFSQRFCFCRRLLQFKCDNIQPLFCYFFGKGFII